MIELIQYAIVGIVVLFFLYLIAQLCIGLYVMRKADKEMKKMQENDFFN